MSSQLPERHLQDDGRPDPEELLKRYQLTAADEEPYDSSSTGEQRHARRGRLRVYLGAAAGVGKTYAMLNEGHRRKERGTDVVVGLVETHKRKQTESQLRDLELIPRKQIQYRGVTLEEMDTDAIIARHPQVVLVDELAHTNVSGSKHVKRYQDVHDILDAGIDVIATLNVQHLESLNDLVQSITGIQVRETLPDSILDQADEVELIDIAPHALRQRMQHGNIYPAERVPAALNNFFREGNLTALRELALRRTADKTESQLQQYMTDHKITTQWSTNERVLVGFDHRPQSRSIIRDAWRLAHGMHADLIAVSIELTGYPKLMHRITNCFRYGHRALEWQETRRQRVEEHALLAEDLGADVLRLTSSDVACTLAEIAKQRHVTQIVLGQPAHSTWEVMLYGSVINRILRLTSDVDIHLVPLERKKKPEG
ncbi:MAG TPA: universal stress protein [Dictyobacter sp.]|jgi:two-component system sensor histidine kinase KdpD|nr:universal stress protein [Dictyobacter sp.]